jgi:hypothetical protein
MCYGPVAVSSFEVVFFVLECYLICSQHARFLRRKQKLRLDSRAMLGLKSGRRMSDLVVRQFAVPSPRRSVV